MHWGGWEGGTCFLGFFASGREIKVSKKQRGVGVFCVEVTSGNDFNIRCWIGGYSISTSRKGSRLAGRSSQSWWHLLPLPVVWGVCFPSGVYFCCSCSWRNKTHICTCQVGVKLRDESCWFGSVELVPARVLKGPAATCVPLSILAQVGPVPTSPCVSPWATVSPGRGAAAAGRALPGC